MVQRLAFLAGPSTERSGHIAPFGRASNRIWGIKRFENRAACSSVSRCPHKSKATPVSENWPSGRISAVVPRN